MGAEKISPMAEVNPDHPSFKAWLDRYRPQVDTLRQAIPYFNDGKIYYLRLQPGTTHLLLIESVPKDVHIPKGQSHNNGHPLDICPTATSPLSAGVARPTSPFFLLDTDTNLITDLNPTSIYGKNLLGSNQKSALLAVIGPTFHAQSPQTPEGYLLWLHPRLAWPSPPASTSKT